MTRTKKDLTKDLSKKNGETVEEISVNEGDVFLANPEIDGKSDNSVLELEQPINPVHKKVDKMIDRSRYFFNRELSWIAFNKRVLHEGIDARTPLLERAKFCAIFSTNLDEFFMVRVAGVKKRFAEQLDIITDDGLKPDKQLLAIRDALVPLVTMQHDFFENTLRPELHKQGVRLLDYKKIDKKHQHYLKTYFREKLFPVLTPLAVDPAHPFPYISNLSLNLVVLVSDRETGEENISALQEELRKQKFGSVVRMEIANDVPSAIRQKLIEQLGITEADVYNIPGLIGLGDLMTLAFLPLPEHQDQPWKSVTHPRLKDSSNERNIFDIIREGDFLVHHPYQSFTTTVQRFIEESANDHKVLAIKQTLYRTSGDSPIVHALIRAAENGKQVAVLVELKARFDEANNILWARKLENAGVHVVYGLKNLKTHTKTALVVRQEGDHLVRYVHIGTGNYNPKTARFYSDLGIFSCRDDLGADLTDLFNYLTGYSRQREYRKLLVAPVNMRDRFLQLIHREIEHQKQGYPSYIIAKMNSLVDPEIISTLYEASQVGVNVDLIIRGICCLRPRVKGLSDRIRVISVIGRFLEHSRIFYFSNGGSEEVYIGSADWMPRNLDARVEVITPVEEPSLVQELKQILEIVLADNRQTWDLHADGTYVQRVPKDGEPEMSSQKHFMSQGRPEFA